MTVILRRSCLVWLLNISDKLFSRSADMDVKDNDSPMPDASSLTSRDDQLHAMRDMRGLRRSMNGSLIAAPPSLSSSLLPNGMKNLAEKVASKAGAAPVAPQATPFDQFTPSSRDSPIFVKEVIEQHSTSTSNTGGTTTPSEDMRGTDTAAEAESRRQQALLPTGLCYDVRMRFHCELDPPKQRVDFHPEDPRRIFCIYDALCLAGLVDDKDNLKNRDGVKILVSRPLMRVFARDATPAEICLVHDKKHYDFIESTKGSRHIFHSSNVTARLTCVIRHD